MDRLFGLRSSAIVFARCSRYSHYSMRVRFALLVYVLMIASPVALLGQSVTKTFGTGSGFVISPDGYVLTNEHVVHGASEIAVVVGGKEYAATVVESLPTQDLALLKIDARGLTAVPLGKSDLLQIGDDVFAIGCPGGICGTVTTGRLANAGVAISIEGGGQLQDMLMVDITTDHGSSGGPLTNSRGEVVGIATAGSQGSFGFSIPINHAIPLLRRVPGFDVAQMGTATSELAFREIRDRCKDAVVYVVNRKRIALSTLLPSEIPGWTRNADLAWAGAGDSRIGRLRQLLTTEGNGSTGERDEAQSLLAALLAQMSATRLCSLLGFSPLLAPGINYLLYGLAMQDLLESASLPFSGLSIATKPLPALPSPLGNLYQSGVLIPVERLGSASVPYAEIVASLDDSGDSDVGAVFLTAVLETPAQALTTADRLRNEDVDGSVTTGVFTSSSISIPYSIGVSLENSTRQGSAFRASSLSIDPGDYCTSAAIDAMATFTIDEVLCTIYITWSVSDCSPDSPSTTQGTQRTVVPGFSVPGLTTTTYPEPHPGTFSFSGGCVSFSHDGKTSSVICTSAIVSKLRDLLNLQLQAVSQAFGD